MYTGFVSLFSSFFFLANTICFYTSLRNVRSLSPLATDQSNPLCYRMRRRGGGRRLEDQRTRMLSFTGQGRKTLDGIRIHFPRFHQCRSSKLLWPNIMYMRNTTHIHTHTDTHKLEGKIAVNGDFFTQGLTQRAGTSSAVLTLWSGCPLFWPSWLCLSTMGKRQTVNYFVHITHVPQLRQEHLVTVPEITAPQWQHRKVRQMEGQSKKSRAASHPLLCFFLSVTVRHSQRGILLLIAKMCHCSTNASLPKWTS